MLFVNFNPFPVIETDRLVLREMAPVTDAENMFRLRGNETAMKYIGKPLLRSVMEAGELIGTYGHNLRERIGITWGISLKQTGGLIGTIGYHKLDLPNHRAEIGYLIHPDHWNKGLMTEALKPILDYGFQEMKLHSVEARINPENSQSRSLLLKYGFVKEAYFKESFYENGVFMDTEVYSLLTTLAE